MPSGQFRKPPTQDGHKWCTLCDIEKPYSEFGRNKSTSDGYGSHCRPCRVAYNNTPERIARRAEINRAYVLSDEQKARKAQMSSRPERRERAKALRNNPEAKERQRLRDARPEVKAKRAAYKTTDAYAASRRKSQSRRYREDPDYRLKVILAVGVRIAMKGQKGWRSTFDLLGYTPAELRTHLETQFVPGMSWENYGRGWQIDHIVPQAMFDCAQPDQLRECWSLTNLQPLWKHLNQAKSDDPFFILPNNWQEVPEYAR